MLCCSEVKMIDLSRAKITTNNIVHKNRFPKTDLSGVERITWLYKISPHTADFRHGDEVVEIQIFAVEFKKGVVNKRELVAIQKIIPYPILFIVHGKSYFTVEDELFESDKQFLSSDSLTIEKRSAKLTDLFEDIAAVFIPLQRKHGESIADLVTRYKKLQTLQRDIATLQRKVNTEKQPNKRIELNNELKKLCAEQAALG